MKNNFIYCYKVWINEKIHFMSNVIDFEFDNSDGFVKVFTDNGTSLLKQDDLIFFGWAKDFDFEV